MMPVGTSDGEYYEDEFDHSVQTSFKGTVDSPVPTTSTFVNNNAPATSTRSPRGNLGDILGMDKHDIPEGVSAMDYFKQLNRQDDQTAKTNAKIPVTDTSKPSKTSANEAGGRSALPLAQGDSTGSRDLFLVRHGCTDMNAEGGTSTDKIRGWANVPLNDVGREDARKAAESLKGKGITAIVASDLDRAKETADIIGKKIGVTPTYTMKLRPWDLGKFTGEPAKESREDLKEYSTTKADVKVPEGESFNTFKFRALQGVSEALQQHPGHQVAIVTHHRVERLLNAWDEAGQNTEGELHEPTFLQKGEPPGGHQIINITPNIHDVTFSRYNAITRALHSTKKQVEDARDIEDLSTVPSSESERSLFGSKPLTKDNDRIPDFQGRQKLNRITANELGERGTEGPYHEWDDQGEINLKGWEDFYPSKIPLNWEKMDQMPNGGIKIKGPKPGAPPLVG